MVRVEWRDRLVLITLDRPERRNAIGREALRDLRAAQVEVASSDRCRAVVLTGAPPAFCSGGDLESVEGAVFAAALGEVLRGFTELAVPVIAAIDGPALGAGTQLVISCDLRVATSASTFGIPAAKIGLVVDQWTVERLGRELGWSHARSMLLTGATVTGEQLARSGGIHRLGTLADALAWAAEIADLAPLTISAHKAMLEAAGTTSGPHPAAAAARQRALDSADSVEGPRAFMEKRRPVFEGR